MKIVKYRITLDSVVFEGEGGLYAEIQPLKSIEIGLWLQEDMDVDVATNTISVQIKNHLEKMIKIEN